MCGTFVRICLVDGDEAALGDVHAGLARIELVAVGAAAHGDEHAVEGLARRDALAFEGDRNAVLPAFAGR
jgi:hypothetical protein